MPLYPFSFSTSRLEMAGLSSVDDANGLRGSLKSDVRPIIALHGWLDNAASFTPLFEQLDSEQPIYALELPGHGHSEHRPKAAQYNLVDNVIDVLAFADSLDEGCEFDLVGHSMGGIVASLVAASVPGRVRNLVLLDSLGPFTDEIENVLPQLRKAVAKASSLRNSKLNVYKNKELAIRARMVGVGKIGFGAAELLVDRGIKEVKGGYIWSSDPRLFEPSLVRFTEKQVEAVYGGIECPVLLIVGDKGYFREYSAIEKRLSYIEKLDKHIVEGGHHFHMEGDVLKTAMLIQVFLTS